MLFNNFLKYSQTNSMLNSIIITINHNHHFFSYSMDLVGRLFRFKSYCKTS